MKLLTHVFELPLRHAFTISRESRSIQPTLIVELSYGKHQCYGEATSNAYYGMTLENMQQALETVRPIVESIDRIEPASLWDEVVPRMQDCPFALCALDEAAHDLWGKQQGAPVYRRPRIPTRYSIDKDGTFIEVLRESLISFSRSTYL